MNRQYIYGIYKENQRFENILIGVFLEEETDLAVLRFKNTIEKEINKEKYSLYRIGTYKDKKIKDMYIFICRGVETKQTRLNLEDIKKEAEENKRLEAIAVRKKCAVEMLKILFKGKIINE